MMPKKKCYALHKRLFNQQKVAFVFEKKQLRGESRNFPLNIPNENQINNFGLV